jgi:hypothetical protein
MSSRMRNRLPRLLLFFAVVVYYIALLCQASTNLGIVILSAAKNLPRHVVAPQHGRFFAALRMTAEGRHEA